MRRVIELHVAAPAKPEEGEPCNGCGVCCASEPCPIGVVVSGRLSGRCAALAWDERSGRYGCGLLGRSFSPPPFASRSAVALMRALVRRWIAAGAGCDSSLTIERLPG